jgi:uncharacterized membrane protein YjgN (DUF898 family)
MENGSVAPNYQSSSVYKDVPLQFNANARDFFGIWFPNLLLSIVTLGFYSPWAKVRNNQYLYGNTTLCGHAFEYTANPVKILIGRIIVVALFMVYSLIQVVGYGIAAVILFLMFALFVPFAVRQAIAFRLRYTRWRGLSFKFGASLGSFYAFFILHAILNALTLYLIFPYTHNKFKQLVINNTYYGDHKFEYQADTSNFYVAYLKSIGISIAPLIVFLLLMFSMPSIEHLVLLAFFIIPILYFGLIALSMFIKGSLEAWIGQIVYNNTSVKNSTMINEWNWKELGWIYLSNFFVVLVTIGLMYPWAKVRLLKYKLENIGFESVDTSGFEGKTYAETNALGEETADFFDFDIGF